MTSLAKRHPAKIIAMMGLAACFIPNDGIRAVGIILLQLSVFVALTGAAQ